MLIAGIQKYFVNLSSLTIANKAYTPAQCVVVLQSLITAGQAAAPLRAQWLSAVEADREAWANNRLFVLALTRSIFAMFTTASTLADFGLSPRKVTPPKPATKVVAAAKGAATRRARKTMGSRQKADVVGEVPATLAIDVQAGTVSVPAPTPTATANGPVAAPPASPTSHTPGSSQP